MSHYLWNLRVVVFLVSVDRISKGYVIIVFRGKDYQRPSTLRPKNLLTKRKALARSIEIQRLEDIRNHVSTLETRVGKLRSEIDQMGVLRDTGDEELYDKLDSTYSTEDEENEEESDEDETYLETDDTYSDGEDEDEDDDENEHSIDNHWLETNFPYDFQYQESEECEDHDPYAAAVNESKYTS